MSKMRGVDVSSLQHPSGRAIDWEVVAEGGYTFAVVKATQGARYVNPWAERDADDAFAAGLLVGAYHFFDPASSAEAQAMNYHDHRPCDPLEAGDWLDWELLPSQEWERPQVHRAFIERCAELGIAMGTYCDSTNLAALRTAACPVGRIWLADWSGTAPPRDVSVVQCPPKMVPGVPVEVDIDELLLTRAVNIPTAPPPRVPLVTAPDAEKEQQSEPTSPTEAAADG